MLGYNYVARWGTHAETFYDEDHRLFPNRRLCGCENPCAGGTRGDHTTDPKPSDRRSDYRTLTLQNEALWRYIGSRDFVAGDFLWTGVDYLGETQWLSKIPTYYFRSIWNENKTTLHVLPHWNWQGQGASSSRSLPIPTARRSTSISTIVPSDAGAMTSLMSVQCVRGTARPSIPIPPRTTAPDVGRAL